MMFQSVDDLSTVDVATADCLVDDSDHKTVHAFLSDTASQTRLDEGPFNIAWTGQDQTEPLIKCQSIIDDPRQFDLKNIDVNNVLLRGISDSRNSDSCNSDSSNSFLW